MVSKVEINKKKKENSLYEAAYDLFITKGIHDTAISDIVKKAGVAKGGTFYLYFKDKYDLLDRIVLNKSAHVLCEAVKNTRLNSFDTFEEELLSFVDYIIEYFKEDKLLLKLIYKNLSWGGPLGKLTRTMKRYMKYTICLKEDMKIPLYLKKR